MDIQLPADREPEAGGRGADAAQPTGSRKPNPLPTRPRGDC